MQSLKVTIMRSTVLPPSALAPVTDWLDGLPYPWCPAAMAVGTAPALAGLQPVLARLHPAMMAA